MGLMPHLVGLVRGDQNFDPVGLGATEMPTHLQSHASAFASQVYAGGLGHG